MRNIDNNIDCFNMNLWMYSLVEKWAWDKSEEELVDRSAGPWDCEPGRPSHQDKRKALQREVLRAVLSAGVNPEEIAALTERLLNLVI